MSTNLLTEMRTKYRLGFMSQVRVYESTHQILRGLAATQGQSMQEIIDQAVEDYRRRLFLKGLNDDFERLRGDSRLWKEHEQEMALWKESTLADGLDAE